MAKQLKVKFDRAADEKFRKGMAPQFGADPGGGVVRGAGFRARRDEQIRLRKVKEKRGKIAAMRSAY
jgi:hypothetical protein